MIPHEIHEKQNPSYLTHEDRLAAGAQCLAAALDYAALGWSVLCLCDPQHYAVGADHRKQCVSPGKAPMHKWKECQTRAMPPEEITRQWRLYPVGNVGAVLGQVSQLVRVDIDGPTGEALLTAWSAGDLPPTWTFRGARTGTGLLYRWPHHLPCRSTAQGLPGDHAELRLMGNGSQTVLPPSRHHTGVLYAWDRGYSPDDLPLAEAPQWLKDRLTQPRTTRADHSPGGATPGQDAVLYTRVQSALRAIPNDGAPYDLWLEIGMALHSTGQDWARSLWDAWSAQSGKYDEVKQSKSWQSFTADGAITLASLFYRARLAGWRDASYARQAVRLWESPTVEAGTLGGALREHATPAASLNIATISAQEVLSWRKCTR